MKTLYPSVPMGTRIGLVLGAGGIAGHAFHAGVLNAIEDATGWDPASAELIVGTSAGSVVGAFLRARDNFPDLAEGPNPDEPLPARLPRSWTAFGAPALAKRAITRPWEGRVGMFLAGALPEGNVSTELVVAELRERYNGRAAPGLWINAVRVDNGERVTFGRPGAPDVSVATAIAASVAIPSYFAPVEIHGVRYVDGGVHSPTNADLLIDQRFDLVVISSPMSIAGSKPGGRRDLRARWLARLLLGREVDALRKSGTKVLVLQPTRADLQVIGTDAMDESKRRPIAAHMYESTRRRLARGDVKDYVEFLRA